MDLFDPAMMESVAAKEQGMDQSAKHATAGWAELMYDLVCEVAATHQYFTSDDVFDLVDQNGLPLSTHDLRAFGPVMMRAARNGICSKADMAARKSRRKSLHASPRAVWRSNVFAG